ncbi:MAG: nitrile hydratase accessory protein [Planctomycetes bacterium]|nr:nitrile hydratase accessory protein [Planctomycetota bacterium]
MSLPALDLLPRIPRDAEGPVFREPWEAQAFALAVRLHQEGVFTWPQWAAALAEEIKRAQGAGDADRGDSYYRHWLAALERLLAEAHVVTPEETRRRVVDIDRAQRRDHAQSDHDHDHDHHHDHD